MINRPSIFVFIFVVLVSAAYGQKPVATPSTTGVSYEDLLAKVKAGDTKVDFRAMRLAYAQGKDASPYGPSSIARSEMNKALKEKRYKDAIRSADEILKSDYVDPYAHMGKAIAHRELGETDKFEFHKAVYLGLMNSIVAGGDGKTFDTAYVVISTDEEYAVMQALGYQVSGQSLQRNKDHTFDVLHGTDPKTNSNVDVYFNIDIVWAMENKMFNPKD